MVLTVTGVVRGTVAMAVTAILIAGMGGAQAEIFTLQDALVSAYQSNPQILSARAGLMARDQGVAQANAGWRPSISASGSYGIDRGEIQTQPPAFNTHPLVGSVTLTQPIFRGGRTAAEIKQAISEVEAGRALLVQTEQSIFLSVVTAYADVVRDRATLSSSLDNVRTLRTVRDAVQTQLKAGAVTRTDANQTEARLARGRADIATAEQQLGASMAAYEQVVGRPAETLEPSPALPVLPGNKGDALDAALKQHPNVVEARANAQSADHAVDDAIGALLPQASISTQYQYLKDNGGTNIASTRLPQNIFNVMAQVTVPLYEGGAGQAGVRKAKDLRAQSNALVTDTERKVGQELATSWQAVMSAKASVTANEDQAAADRTALDGVMEAQRAGERSVLDVLNAQQEVVSAEISANAARRDAVVTAYRLLAATGNLTARTLALKVDLYDPLVHYNASADAWLGLGE